MPAFDQFQNEIFLSAINFLNNANPLETFFKNTKKYLDMHTNLKYSNIYRGILNNGIHIIWKFKETKQTIILWNQSSLDRTNVRLCLTAAGHFGDSKYPCGSKCLF